MVFALAVLLATQTVPVLQRAYSHNDYAQPRPLAEALENGFSAVEADVFPVGGKLLVSHSRKDLDPSRDIESMYLVPLEKRLAKNSGWVYGSSHTTFWILVDFKDDGAQTYALFKKIIEKHPRLKRPAIRFIMSGNRPAALIAADGGRFAAIDGRWEDLDKGYPADLMPWISEDWFAHFKWQGQGTMPVSEQKMLDQMVEEAHSQKRMIRFWGGPDVEAVWNAEWDAGVDWINTDHLAKVGEWMAGKTSR